MEKDVSDSLCWAWCNNQEEWLSEAITPWCQVGYEINAGLMEHGGSSCFRACIAISLASYKFSSADVDIHSQDPFIRSINLDT